jgi:hypothetical protein
MAMFMVNTDINTKINKANLQAIVALELILREYERIRIPLNNFIY